MRLRHRLVALVALSILLPTGCAEEGSPCPDGEALDTASGECVAIGSDAGMDGGGDVDAGEDGGTPDAGPCGMACGEPTPICNEDTGQCVACVGDSDCPEADASQCVGGVCEGCGSDANCEHLSDLPVCSDGTCVECTPDTEEDDCGLNACDPVAFECTSTGRETLGPCEPCLADSECEAGHFCVPMAFMGADRGHYCMPEVPTGGCGLATPPWRSVLDARASRSGVAPTTYCGINESLTTCEAVIAALDAEGVGCTVGDGSACPEGGHCSTVGIGGAGGNRCTYDCNDPVQCPSSPNLAACPSADSYCGEP